MTAIYLAGQGCLEAHSQLDYPRPDRLIAGNPQRETHSLYEHPNMNCGFWHCEIGHWQIVFADNKQEFFQLIEGRVRLHDANQTSYVEIQAGEAGIIPPGFVGSFEVLEKVKKYFVLVES